MSTVLNEYTMMMMMCTEGPPNNHGLPWAPERPKGPFERGHDSQNQGIIWVLSSVQREGVAFEAPHPKALLKEATKKRYKPNGSSAIIQTLQTHWFSPLWFSPRALTQNM